VTKTKEVAAHEPIPAEYTGQLETYPAVQKGRAIVKAAGIDTSGYDKPAREARRVGWALHLHGGAATSDREALVRTQIALGEARHRAEKLKAAKADESRILEAEASVRSAEKNVARFEALVNAAGDAHLHDQHARRAARDQAAAALETIRGRLAPYRMARIFDDPRLPEWELEELEAERHLAKAEAEWQAGVVELHRLGDELQKLTGKAQSALGAELGTVAGGLGVKVRGLLQGDLEFLSANPHRCPPEAVAIYKQVQELAELAVQLDVGGVMQRFAKAADAALPIIESAIGGRALPLGNDWVQRTKEPLSPSSIMGAIL